MRLLGWFVAAAVAAPALAAAVEDAPEERRKERRICRSTPDSTTRIRPPRVCMTQREWDAVTERARDDLSATQNKQTVVVNGPAGRSTCPTGIPC